MYSLGDQPPVQYRKHLEEDGVADMTQLEDLHDGAVLYNLKKRFEQQIIYTYIGSILLSVNPYKMYNIYGTDTVLKYKGKSFAENPPHLFAIANVAYSKMVDAKHNQCIIISGESGSGKTEATKLVLRYLAAVHHKRKDNVTQQILEATPLLESFGNAKTVRNDNSSRFGKYIEIFLQDGVICGAITSQYLLEKSRIVFQAKNERNYHIFYEMLAGLSSQQKQRFYLQEAETYYYLNQGGNCEISGKNDGEDFLRLLSSMEVLSFSPDEQNSIFRILSSVLHLGNVYFEKYETDSQEIASVVSAHEIRVVAELLQISPEGLQKSITYKVTETMREKIFTPLTVESAVDARDAVAKILYSLLFSWLTDRINKLVSPKTESLSIAILDIYGFEDLSVNSFEQLCINYANEYLQYFFNKIIFKLEQEEYIREQIDWKEIIFSDNQTCLDLISQKPHGILRILDDQSCFPQATDHTFLQKCHYHHGNNPLYSKPKMPLPEFTIKHYAGKVTYQVHKFIEKNHDQVRQDVMELFVNSKRKILTSLFSGQTMKIMSTRNNTISRRYQAPTVAAKFQQSLMELAEKMESCNPFFVRCIKPNNKKESELFEVDVVSSQLRYSGVLETIRIRKEGYPVRIKFDNFIKRYKILLGLTNQIKADGENYVTILKQIVPVSKGMYSIGLTKLFLKENLYHILESKRDTLLLIASLTLQRYARGFFARKRYIKLRRTVILLQASARGYIARKKFQKFKESLIKVRSIVLMFANRRRFLRLREQKRERIEMEQTMREVVNVAHLDIPAELASLLQAAAARKENHSDCIIQIETPKVQSEEQLIMALDINNYPFSRFVWAHFKKHLFGMLTTPLDEALTQSEEDLKEDAVLVFKLIMRFMGDPHLNGAQEILFGDYVAQIGLASPSLRDEILAQLANQVWRNANDKNAERGWLLLATCLSCFAPSSKMDKYLLKFVSDYAYNGFKSVCQHKLMQAMRRARYGPEGARSYPPCLLEWTGNKRKGNIALEVSCFDGVSFLCPVNSWITGEELGQDILRHRGVTEGWHGWSVARKIKGEWAELGGHDYTMDLVSDLELMADFPRQKSYFIISSEEKARSWKNRNVVFGHGFDSDDDIHSPPVPKAPIFMPNSDRRLSGSVRRGEIIFYSDASNDHRSQKGLDRYLDSLFDPVLSYENADLERTSLVSARMKGGGKVGIGNGDKTQLSPVRPTEIPGAHQGYDPSQLNAQQQDFINQQAYLLAQQMTLQAMALQQQMTSASPPHPSLNHDPSLNHNPSAAMKATNSTQSAPITAPKPKVAFPRQICKSTKEDVEACSRVCKDVAGCKKGNVAANMYMARSHTHKQQCNNKQILVESAEGILAKTPGRTLLLFFEIVATNTANEYPAQPLIAHNAAKGKPPVNRPSAAQTPKLKVATQDPVRHTTLNSEHFPEPTHNIKDIIKQYEQPATRKKTGPVRKESGKVFTKKMDPHEEAMSILKGQKMPHVSQKPATAPSKEKSSKETVAMVKPVSGVTLKSSTQPVPAVSARHLMFSGGCTWSATLFQDRERWSFVPSLPVDGVDLLLGNDLVGVKVTASSVVLERPKEVKETEQLQERVPGIFPDCVVIPSMAKHTPSEDAELALPTDDPIIGLSEIIFGKLEDPKDGLNGSSLVEAQQADPGLKKISQSATHKCMSQETNAMLARTTTYVHLQLMRPVGTRGPLNSAMAGFHKFKESSIAPIWQSRCPQINQQYSSIKRDSTSSMCISHWVGEDTIQMPGQIWVFRMIVVCSALYNIVQQRELELQEMEGDDHSASSKEEEEEEPEAAHLAASDAWEASYWHSSANLRLWTELETGCSFPCSTTQMLVADVPWVFKHPAKGCPPAPVQGQTRLLGQESACGALAEEVIEMNLSVNGNKNGRDAGPQGQSPFIDLCVYCFIPYLGLDFVPAPPPGAILRSFYIKVSDTGISIPLKGRGSRLHELLSNQRASSSAVSAHPLGVVATAEATDPGPAVEPRTSASISRELTGEDERIQTQLHGQPCEGYYTYSKMPCDIYIRKEVFYPKDSFHSPVILDLIFRQIVNDTFSETCVRLNKEEQMKMKSLLAENKIQASTLVKDDAVKRKIVMAARETWDVYFCRLFPASGSVGTGVQILGVSHKGISLLKLVRASSPAAENLRVLRSYSYTDILFVTIPSKNMLDFNLINEKLILFSSKAPQVKSMIDYFITELKKDSNYVIAVKSHITNNSSYLRFHKGDIIRLQPMEGLEEGKYCCYGCIVRKKVMHLEELKKYIPDFGWKFGAFHGRSGLFPLEYVQPVAAPDFIHLSTDKKEEPMDKKGKVAASASAAVAAAVGSTAAAEELDRKTEVVGKYRDSEFVESMPEYILQGNQCTMIEFAKKYFRQPHNEFNKEKSKKGKDPKDPAELVKYTKIPIQESLIEFSNGNMNKLAAEIFVAIMKFMGDYPLKGQTEQDTVYTILKLCGEHEVMKDETYCQIIKQITDNTSSKIDSAQRGWRLLYILTAYYKCSEVLKPFLFKFLESVCRKPGASFQGIAKACDHNLKKTFQFGGRTRFPDGMELKAMVVGRSSKRQVFLLSGNVERHLKIKTCTVVVDVIEDFCSEMGLQYLEAAEEYSLFVIINKGQNVQPLKNKDYILDVAAEMEQVEPNFTFCFRRVLWFHPLKFENELCVTVHYNQIVPDFLKGLLHTLTQDMMSDSQLQQVSKLAALQHRAKDSLYLPTIREVQDYIPSQIYRHQRPQPWLNMVTQNTRHVQALSSHQARAQFIGLVSAFPMFGSSFFYIQSSSNSVIVAPCILAINQNGFNFLNKETHELMVNFPLKEIQSTLTQRSGPSNSYPYVEIKLGDLMSQRITQLQLDQALEMCHVTAMHVESMLLAREKRLTLPPSEITLL
ncbi:unconventional myosin-XV [Heterodontus francisci]|uniref:unconventional myosin-XV n=1 Tax=Heterodontus francisci TaxID=7792 RepID=UPI00355BF733